MAGKILIIGGTYFLGKAFAELMLRETDFDITLLHRGSGMMGNAPVSDDNENGRLRNYLADRHDAEALRNFCTDAVGSDSDSAGRPHFDAIVDFCAYSPGDIGFLLENINADADQYVFISTTDVYKRGTGTLQNEDAELEERNFGGPAGEYISGKVTLEREIASACEKAGCRYTVLRPAFIYGPGNYAPRESIYFQWIDRAKQIIHPADADGEFQLVFVKDVAGAIKLVIGNPEAFDKRFNVCENRMYTYDSFAELLIKATGVDFVKAEVSVETVNAKGIPLPFPLTQAETNRYDGSRLSLLGLKFTNDVDAMRETYEKYKASEQ